MDSKFDSEEYGIAKLTEARDKYHTALEPIAAATKPETSQQEEPERFPAVSAPDRDAAPRESTDSVPKHHPAIQEQLAHINPGAHAAPEPEVVPHFAPDAGFTPEPEPAQPATDEPNRHAVAHSPVDPPALAGGVPQFEQPTAPPQGQFDMYAPQWQPPPAAPPAPSAPQTYGAGPVFPGGGPAPLAAGTPHFAPPAAAAAPAQFQAPSVGHPLSAGSLTPAGGGYPGNAAPGPYFAQQGPPTMMGAPIQSAPAVSAPNHAAQQHSNAPYTHPGAPGQQQPRPAPQAPVAPPTYPQPVGQPREPWQAHTPAAENAAGVNPFALKDPKLEKPKLGWRAAAARWGAPVGKNDAEVKRDREIQRINKVFKSPKVVGVLSFKGGVGKTTSTITLGSTIASLRHEGAIVAIDAVARGTLGMRLEQQSEGSIKHFAYEAAANRLSTDSEVGWFLATNNFRLRVLASDNSKEPLWPHEYQATINVLASKHRMILVDMDPSIAHPSFETIMHSLDALVLIVPTSIGGAERGRDALQWLRENDLAHLPTLVLINQQTPVKPFLDIDELAGHFRGAEGRETLIIKWDPHLAEEGPVNLDLVDKKTRRKFEWASALLMDMLPGT
ncbi:hypothetical protein BKG82_26515 [Mycobacteroides chelonae]|uniref:Uncharacterized protein n=1 Tax=Mycobacteroides chelonae TaxID=1774 RepID=A0A1S1LIP7_MYCCH|nr:AAA family ATPase [Mycobacteroides chelonae]OHU47212.1 hypothetical protein BKG82_26515 [Mycobacteroides chelonae]